jgi:hypothetical protein
MKNLFPTLYTHHRVGWSEVCQVSESSSCGMQQNKERRRRRFKLQPFSLNAHTIKSMRAENP